MSVRRAAKQFNVPVQTLRDRVKGRIDPSNLGNEVTLFSHEEELSLVEHVEVLAQLGYGITNNKLKDLGGELAEVLGKKKTSKSLSNCWLYGFLERWRGRVRSLKPSSLETSRAKSSTPEIVDRYFDNLRKVIDDHSLSDKPQFIFNLDETGIQPEHRPPNIIAPVTGKPQSVTSPRSTTTTVIACVNAAGNHLPPYFIYKGKRMNTDLNKGSSPGTRIVMSETGWSNSDVFKDYLQNHFLPNVRSSTNESQPILLIFDGHASHTSKQLIDWAVANNIILFVLPAHTSHILQPLDVGIFAPFKGYYYRECAVFMRENMGRSITKYEMTEIACKAYLRAMNPANIVAAFKKTGIYPLDRNVIEQDKLFPSEAFVDSTPIKKVIAIKSGKDAVEKYLQMKTETTKASSKPCGCICSCSTTDTPKTTKQRLSKPKPGGRDITNQSFIETLNLYEEEKENVQSKGKGKGKHVQKRGKLSSTRENIDSLNPRPSTSGLNINIHDESDTESMNDDTEVCCVCGRFYPPNDNKRPYLKIVTWAYCDKCTHCVHLAFCHTKTVVRRGDTFLCPHCE